MAYPAPALRQTNFRHLRRAAIVGLGLMVGAFVWAGAGTTAATATPDTPPPTTVPAESENDQGTVLGGDTAKPEDATLTTLPLIPQPAGCDPMPLPHVVFVGTAVAADARTVKFHIDSIRGGTTDPYATNGEIDVRYGHEAQYLMVGNQYLVSAVRDLDLGLLASRLTPPVEDFGGDEVLGVNESDLRCPQFDDPDRTLNLDGTAIDVNVLEPLVDAKGEVLAALVVPAAVAFGVIFTLSLLRISVSGLMRLMFRRERHLPPGI